MNVFLPCNYTGYLREAFKKKGHFAVSCDLLPSEIPGLHIQGDALDYLNGMWLFDCGQYAALTVDPRAHRCQVDRLCFFRKITWDMMVAYGPPCTDLSGAGARYWREKITDGRILRAYEFVLNLWNAPIEKVCIENPTGWLNTHWMKPAQTIHPYMFGSPYVKRSCLWLRGLPLLKPQNAIKPERHWLSSSCRGGKLKDGTRRKSKLPMGNAWEPPKVRGRSFLEICEAMADQWG